jgi:RNA polymerase-binding transcription factor DksA
MAADTREWLRTARRSWETQRAELLGDGLIGSNERDSTGELDHGGQHPADLGSEVLEREIDLSLLAEADEILAEIADAERRLAAGVYGQCETCHEPIPRERLEAIPWARRCLTHQTPVERYEAV